MYSLLARVPEPDGRGEGESMTPEQKKLGQDIVQFFRVDCRLCNQNTHLERLSLGMGSVDFILDCGHFYEVPVTQGGKRP